MNEPGVRNALNYYANQHRPHDGRCQVTGKIPKKLVCHHFVSKTFACYAERWNILFMDDCLHNSGLPGTIHSNPAEFYRRYSWVKELHDEAKRLANQDIWKRKIKWQAKVQEFLEKWRPDHDNNK